MVIIDAKTEPIEKIYNVGLFPDVRASQADLRRAENEVALQVRQIYIEILIGRLETQAMAVGSQNLIDRSISKFDTMTARGRGVLQPKIRVPIHPCSPGRH